MNSIKRIITIILSVILTVEQPCFITVLAADASGNTKVVTEEASGNEIIEEDDLIESEELVDGVEDTQRGLDTVDDTLESEEVIDGAEEGEHVLIVSGGEEGVDYSWSDDGVLTVKTSTPLVIDGQGIKVTDEQIVLGDAANEYEINITLKNVKITSSTGAAIKIPDDYSEDVNIVLDGENIIKSGMYFAGLEKNGGSNTGILTIVGEGSIDSSGDHGAGIGGGYQGAGNNITINGGIVTATGGYYGAGIGGGYCGAGSNITISGGTVTATGGDCGAGIGGGKGSAGSNITISGGTVTAKGGDYGAGIGGGDNGEGSNITISEGTVTAKGWYYGAGIGGGINGPGSDITISGGTVTATGGNFGAGIGGGGNLGGGKGSAGSNITISGGIVTSTGGWEGAGIGGGNNGEGSDITISGGTVTATGGYYGAGIGGGREGAGSDIKIENASVKAVAGRDANDFGGGSGCDAVIPLDHNDGDNVYLVCLPHEDNLTIKYKLHSEEEWNTIIFPEKHENDERFYLYLKEGVYDLKSGTAEYSYVPVGTYGGVASKEVSTRKIIIDELVLGDELIIVSENCYKMGNVVYDCSAATDSYFIEQRTSETLNKNIVVKKASKIIVKNLNLCPENKAAFFVDSESDVEIYSDAESESIFKSPECHAGIEKAESAGMLILDGEGSITATGGSSGAGIGGGIRGAGNNITINGGIVTATGGSSGTGIGGGYQGAGNNITINGGIVTATGGLDGAAGIGGGDNGEGSNITISEGTVTATGGNYGAGIGGGREGAGSNITISGGTVTATGSSAGAGIGGGDQGTGSNITISGGTVTATGGYEGAGIGGGDQGAGNNITISGGTVTATGGHSGAGIGGGIRGAGSDIKIENASVKAVAGYDANDIGGGSSCDAVIPLDHNDGDNVYLVCLPHEDNLTIKYKLHSEEEWNTIIFPEKHENDERFYLYLKEGVYDLKSGTAEYLYVPVGTYGEVASKEVSTRKIIIDELVLGDELIIVSENCYKMGNVVYDCSAATDSYFIEQRTSETLNKNIVVKEASKIIVKNLNLCPENKAAFFVDSESDVEIYSDAESESIFKSPEYHAGIEKAESTGMLILDGEGSITATGGYYGAGIGGGGFQGAGNNITINGGVVTATGGSFGAGIGGVASGEGSNITISGGKVTATGGYSGAGIGGGNRGAGNNITISGGKVTATGGSSGAGIGGGDRGSGNNITINDGTVTATGGTFGAGIGGGSSGEGSNITISGGIVTTKGGSSGTGIGGGSSGEGSNITISGGTVTATGGTSGAGIGSKTKTSDIFISGGSIKTNSIGCTPVISESDSTELILVEIGGYAAGDVFPFTSIPDAKYYNLDGVTAHDDGHFYFYLPEGVDVSKFKVQFVNTGNSEIPDQIVMSGDKVLLPDEPVREGCSFRGWYKSEHGGSDSDKWNFDNDVVRGDVILYGGWIVPVSRVLIKYGNEEITEATINRNEKLKLDNM